MVYFETLNDGDDSNSEYSDKNDLELELESLSTKYLEALGMIKLNRKKDAIHAFNEILESSIIHESLDIMQDIQDSQIHSLQYSIFKNYAKLLPPGKESLMYYQKAAQVDPSDSKLLMKISDLQEQLGNLEGAYNTILKILKLPLLRSQENHLLAALSRILYNHGWFDQSMIYVKQVLETIPDHPECLAIKKSIETELAFKDEFEYRTHGNKSPESHQLIPPAFPRKPFKTSIKFLTYRFLEYTS